nr:OST-HTH/LOTUS domain-containing protein [Fontimonas thermophila]
MRDAVEAASDDEGWAGLGAVGSLISKQAPDFDARNYGFRKLSDLVVATGLFEIDERRSADGRQKTMFLRDKRKKR